MDDDRPCFGSHWIGKTISFEEPLSKWILREKLGDKKWQLDEAMYKSLLDAPSPSAAYGTFVCENVHEPQRTAIMRITMQIPYAGSELLPRSEVLKQALPDKLPTAARAELEALRTLTDNGCDSAPTLLDFRLDQQDADDLLPGGFILYQLTSQAPGVRLDHVRWSLSCCPEDDIKEANFWQFEFKERERIRQAVKFAWLNCKKSGIIAGPRRGHLVWDAAANKITIVGFRDSSPDEPGIIWRDSDWFIWGLAVAPRGFKFPDDEAEEARLDLTNWIL